jgi:hypothetical protein
MNGRSALVALLSPVKNSGSNYLALVLVIFSERQTWVPHPLQLRVRVFCSEQGVDERAIRPSLQKVKTRTLEHEAVKKPICQCFCGVLG